MINLFDDYNSSTQDLHQSLIQAELDHLTVVCTFDGFLPKNDLTPYHVFMEDDNNEEGRPLFFNELKVPEF